MPFIRRIRVRSFRQVPDFELELPDASPGKPAHLILTGPNGSGKTSIVEQLGRSLDYRVVTDKGPVEVSFTDPGLGIAARSGQHVSLYRPAVFTPKMSAVSGPTAESKGVFEPQVSLGDQLVQFLVNRKTQQAFALADGDAEAAATIASWFEQLTLNLARLLAVPSIELEFDRQRFDFTIVLKDKRRFSLTQLAHGHMSALTLLGDLMIRISAAKRVSGDAEDPTGVVVIDELETHLHLELQELILPFLCETFPTLQFVVATHAPAIVASIDDAIVYDLRRGETRWSAEFRGVRYGTVMTQHFGISSDFDLRTTEQLQRLKQLRRMPLRTPEQEAELRGLAESLSRTSHGAALEVWTELEERRLTSVAREGDD